jgi:hypothetical protein
LINIKKTWPYLHIKKNWIYFYISLLLHNSFENSNEQNTASIKVFFIQSF